MFYAMESRQPAALANGSLPFRKMDPTLCLRSLLWSVGDGSYSDGSYSHRRWYLCVKTWLTYPEGGKPLFRVLTSSNPTLPGRISSLCHLWRSSWCTGRHRFLATGRHLMVSGLLFDLAGRKGKTHGVRAAEELGSAKARSP